MEISGKRKDKVRLMARIRRKSHMPSPQRIDFVNLWSRGGWWLDLMRLEHTMRYNLMGSLSE